MWVLPGESGVSVNHVPARRHCWCVPDTAGRGAMGQVSDRCGGGAGVEVGMGSCVKGWEEGGFVDGRLTWDR